MDFSKDGGSRAAFGAIRDANSGRLALLDDMISGFAVDGVIDLARLVCHTSGIGAFGIGKWIEQKFNLPTLHLEIDYSQSDREQLRVPIEAYLGML